MTRSFKSLGLALMAVLAMSAFAASAAQATGQLTVTAPSTYPVDLTGTQLNSNVLAVGGGVRNMSCTGAALAGTLAGPQTSTTITAVYTGCTATPGSLTATINMTSCDYTLSGVTVSGATGTFSTKIDCGTLGDGIDWRIYKTGTKHEEASILCRYSIPAQTLTGTSQWHNRNSGTSTEDVELTFSAEPVPTINVVTGTALLCGAAAGKSTTGTYTGNVTVTGSKAGAHVPIHVG